MTYKLLDEKDIEWLSKNKIFGEILNRPVGVLFSNDNPNIEFSFRNFNITLKLIVDTERVEIPGYKSYWKAQRWDILRIELPKIESTLISFNAELDNLSYDFIDISYSSGIIPYSFISFPISYVENDYIPKIVNSIFKMYKDLILNS